MSSSDILVALKNIKSHEGVDKLRPKIAKLHISLEEIVSATNNFSDDNLIKRGSIADVHKGKLRSNDQSDVIIRRFRPSLRLQYPEFIKEVFTLSYLNHTNILSFVGFCDDHLEMVMVFKYEDNGSLDKYLSDPNLTWSQKLKICVGVANALSYIHKVTERYVSHGFIQDIKSIKILLDKHWEAKLFCLGFHIGGNNNSNNNSNNNNNINNINNIIHIKDYISNDVAFRSPSHVSYVYSFGIVLFEVICGRKAPIGDDKSLVSVATRLYEEGKLEDMINPDLRIQMHPLSLIIFSQIAYDCVKKSPRMDLIVGRLQDASDLISTHETLEKEYAYLKIPLSDIMLATQNFSSTYCISSLRDDMVYEVDLNHFDVNSFFTTEGKIRGENIKVCGPVTIKRNFSKNYEQVAKYFIAEIRMFVGRKHPNIVSLVGFSLEGYEMILIFESHVLYKSLADHLGSISEKTNLMQRIRICLDIAQGLDYFHNIMDAVGPVRIHQGMLSTNVMLDENWNAKIATFRLYPEYIRSPRETEIYSFGVVIFEILCGKLAYDPYNTRGDSMELVRITQSCFEEGTFQSMVDPNIMKEVREDSYMIAPFRRSLNALKRIAYRCLFEYNIILPLTLKHIINSLNRALSFREETLERLKIQLSHIKAATKDFTETFIGEGGYGVVYRAELDVFDKKHHSIQKRTVAIKCDPRKNSELGNKGFLAELEIASRCEHPNIISLLGFCFEDSENILVFEFAANGSLGDYVEKGKLSKLPWARRLRMCLDIAYGLSYLHTSDDDKTCIIHRDIKSGNILLGENLEVKISDFGLSIFHPKNHPSSTINTKHIAGTNMYIDPEYEDGKLKIESDIYSFGVVLFEILSGKLAYDRIYTKENGNGIAAVARQRLRDGKLMEMVDITIMEEAHELSSTIKMRPTQDSLDEFFKVACKCVAEAQADRPKMEEVINGLKKAIDLQKNRKDTLEIPLEDISLGGENLSNTNCNIEKGYGMYDGEVQYDNETKPVIIKRMSKCDQEPLGSWREFEIPFKHKHENVIGLVGYFKKMNEKFIVYENAINKSLDMHVGNATLTWTKRLKIGIDIANGLKFLHGSDEGQDVVIHRDLKSSNILLTGDWKAKVCGFDASIIYPNNHNIRYADDGIGGYCDIYCFGVILYELLCGRLVCTVRGQSLDSLFEGQFEVDRPDKLVFERIREQIVWKSLVTFTTIAFNCLNDDRDKRPTPSEVVVQLQQALELQEAQEIWDTKLPRNYSEILKFSNTPEIYSTMEKKDIYNILSHGISLQKGKLWYSIGGNGERNEMVSARMFSYKNRWSHRWRSIKESRFEKVAELLDISNLNIEIKISSQLLLPGVDYSVHLVFKFCCPRKSVAKRMYVNLKYKMGNENLNAYFATWREDGWLMIELCRFSNPNKEKIIKILLKSFSRCYCDSRAIYIEGIVFQAIDDVKREETQHVLEFKSEMDKVLQKIEKCDDIQQPILKPNSEMTKLPATDMASMRQEVVAKKWVLYNYSNVKLLYSNSSSRTRFEGMELLRRQSAYSIKWKIGSQKVSPIKDHVCYLLFKLSENCRGLYCPVLVRNQERWKSKEIIYFRQPSPSNVHETDRVPKERSDGWMEVIVWIYNLNYKLRNDSLHVKLKLTTYQGTMSGLIIGGLEFRPMEK